MNVTDSKNQFSNEIKDNSKPFFNSMTMRIIILIILLFLSMIPIKLLENLVDYRITEKQNSIDELSNQWGNEQTIIGPILSIPYVERISRIESQTDSTGVKRSVSKDIFYNKTLRLLPENLTITAEIKEKYFDREVVETNAYEADISLIGNFNLESLPETSGYNTIEWDKAILSVGLSDNSSVEASTPLRWEESSTIIKPGTKLIEHLKNGVHANLEEVANENTHPQFRFQFTVKGKKNLRFAPLGELSNISITSDSTEAKVFGQLTPTSKVSSSEGLEATWRVSNLNRNYPQQWIIDDKNQQEMSHDFAEVLPGIELSLSNEELSKIKKYINYLSIILSIVFLSLFILEFKRNSKLKPNLIHYLLISLSILLVPILLITLSDMVEFIQGYQIAAGTSAILIIFFVLSSLKSVSKGFYILLILASLYAALFVIIEMPEYAFAASSAAGLLITIVLMFTSVNTSE